MYSRSSVTPRTIGGLIEDIFDKGIGRAFGEDAWNDNAGQAPVNILETDKAYELHLFVPGLKKEEFKVNVDRNILIVSFDHQEEAADESVNRWLRKEYRMRSFKRSFTLNDKIDPAAIFAKYIDGVLIVTLPKKEAAEHAPQQISVS